MLGALLILSFLGFVAAENGLAAWLHYALLPHAGSYHLNLPSTIVALNARESSPVYTAGQELQKGLLGIFDRQTTLGHIKQASSSSIVVGTVAEYTKAYGVLQNTPDLIEDGFWLDTKSSPVRILALNERGAL